MWEGCYSNAIPISVEPKKFNSIGDAEGILKNVGGKKSVGLTLFFLTCDITFNGTIKLETYSLPQVM
jgi:hypothetical protein